MPSTTTTSNNGKKVTWKTNTNGTAVKKDINGNNEKENENNSDESLTETQIQLTDLKQKQLEKQQKQQNNNKPTIQNGKRTGVDQKNKLNGSKSVPQTHETPKRSNSEPDFVLKQKSPEQYHVCIMCTPEKKFFMKNLQTQLEKLGYACKLCSSNDNNIPILESDAIICCLSWRLSKSSIAAREIAKAEKLQKPIVPLLCDNIEYPPSGPLRVSMSRLVPVDCSAMKINAKWEGREQTEDILDRLEAYVNDDAVSKHRKRSSLGGAAVGRKQTNIPRAANSIWREKPSLPVDPLAREASEIRIMIRPPTPVRRDVSNIPLPERLINHSKDDVEEEDETEEEDDDEVEDSEDSYEDDVSSNKDAQDTEEEIREETPTDESHDAARRRLEKLNKLPQLPDAKRKVEQNNHYASVGSGQNKTSSNSSRNQSNQSTKLPSVYASSKNASANRRY